MQQTNRQKINMITLQQKYEKEVTDAMKKEFGIKNSFALPRLTKIVVNSGIGEVAKNKDVMEAVIRDMSIITGQKPSIKKAKVSVASFSVRQGMPVGIMVTLRGKRMYDFLNRVFSLVLPRFRDFRGVSLKSFDKAGNYTLAILEHTLFPEIDVTKASKVFSFEITFVIKNSNIEKSKKYLSLMGMPFVKEEN